MGGLPVPDPPPRDSPRQSPSNAVHHDLDSIRVRMRRKRWIARECVEGMLLALFFWATFLLTMWATEWLASLVCASAIAKEPFVSLFFDRVQQGTALLIIVAVFVHSTLLLVRAFSQLKELE